MINNVPFQAEPISLATGFIAEYVLAKFVGGQLSRNKQLPTDSTAKTIGYLREAISHISVSVIAGSSTGLAAITITGLNIELDPGSFILFANLASGIVIAGMFNTARCLLQATFPNQDQ